MTSQRRKTKYETTPVPNCPEEEITVEQHEIEPILIQMNTELYHKINERVLRTECGIH